MKKIHILFMLMVFTFTSVLWCIASGEKAGVKEKPTKEITISVWTAYPETHEFSKWLGEKYHAANPHITIDAVLFPQRALDEKIAATLPAGQAGDVIAAEILSIMPYAEAGYVDYVPDKFTTWSKKNFPSSAIKFCTLPSSGKLFIIPYTLSAMCMFYNTDHFKEAGLAGPPKTIEEQMEYARKVTKYDTDGNPVRVGLDLRLGGGGWGICDKFQNQAMIPYGVDLLEQVGNKFRAAYNNDAGVKAVQYYLDALYKYKVEGFETKSDAEGFGLGVCSMFERESWVVSYMEGTAPNINYGSFLMPKGPGGWGTLVIPEGLFVSANSALKKEAWDFIEFWVNDENAIESFKRTGWQPGRINVDYSPIFNEYPQLKAFVDAFNTPGHELIPYKVIPCNLEVRTRFGEMLLEALKRPELVNSPRDIRKALDEMAKETNRILDEYEILAE